MHHPTDKTHTTAFVTPVVEHWLERDIAQWVQWTEVLVVNLLHYIKSFVRNCVHWINLIWMAY